MPFLSNGTTWGSSATAWDNAAAVWDALTAGPVPALTLHADAGSGASYTLTGNRHHARLTITTGASPVPGGTLATLALLGYTNPPYADVSPRDEVSAATTPIIDSPTNTQAVLKVAGELEPGTTYSYQLAFGGV